MENDELYGPEESTDDLFQPVFNFSDDPEISDILQSILPQEEMEEVEEPEEPEEDPENIVPLDSDGYQDLGEYRSYDGNREYHSFDASLPDASPDQWYLYSEEDQELDDDYDSLEDESQELPPRRRHPVLSGIAHGLLAFFTILSAFYLIIVYSDFPVVNRLRTMYIQTAMSTLNHKWMATAIIPGSIIDDVLRMRYETDDAMAGKTSTWGNVNVQALPSFSAETIPEGSDSAVDSANETEEASTSDGRTYSSKAEQTFFELFWELDYDSVMDYMDEHPEALENGWSGVDINESGLDDEGTSMKTIYGDQVLAVNAVDGITLIRIYPENSRGVLAICKDTSRLELCAASTLGVIGQTAGRICDDNDGVLAFTANGFMDDGTGNGGEISGMAVCGGEVIGHRLAEEDYSAKRLELREDDRMYIVDSYDELGEGTRDACEFHPALIIDGVVFEQDWWNSPNPRTTLGQTERLETIAVVVEGRHADSLGCGTEIVAKLMAQYGCVQAMNLDGGTSAMMYYKGEYLNRCANDDLPEGRTLPTAWVYHGAE